jgi:iron complex transport system substrate-binding protein
MLPRRRFLTLSAAMAAQVGFPARAFALEDAVGNTLNLPSTPRRIIAIHPAMVESVVSLGAEDRLVGIGGVVRYPESVLSLPRIGGALNFSVEATLALNPDLVVMAMDTDATAQLARPLTAMGVPVFLAKYPDFVSITRYIRLLGAVLDLGNGAERVITAMQAKVAALAERLAGRPVRRIYLETGAAGTGAFQTIRAGHYAEDTIRRAGGLNAFDLKGPPQVTLEGLAAADPDAIVVLASDPAMTAASVASRPGWTALRAVREERLKVLPRGFMLIPGPRQADAIEILARAIHPEAFGS